MTSTPPTTAAVADALAGAGLSNRKVEQATGISRETLRRKLANEQAFTLGEIERIAKVLGIAPEELVARRGRAA